MKQKKVHPRILYVDNSVGSRKAIELLKKNKVIFSAVNVDPDSVEWTDNNLPCLITGECINTFVGTDRIKKYIKATVALGEQGEFEEEVEIYK